MTYSESLREKDRLIHQAIIWSAILAYAGGVALGRVLR